MKTLPNRLSVLLLAAVLLLGLSLGISSGQAKYTQQIDVKVIDLNVQAIPVVVTDLYYNGTSFYADPDCTIPVTVENGKLVASKNGTTINRMSKFNEVEGDFNIWLQDTYTTVGNETITGDYTICRYEGFTDTMISVASGSPTIGVTVDGGNKGGTASYWDDDAKETKTQTISPLTANAPAISVNGGNLILSGTVRNNTNNGGDGGGILVLSGGLNCTGATVTGNHASGNGGGICYEYGEADVGDLLDTYESFVTGNSANGKGPQVYPFEKEVFAVLDTDGVLHFYDRMGVPKPGDTYDGVTVEKVYRDFINTGYVPWCGDADSVNSVVVEDPISPTTTANWFKDMDNVTDIDLTKLDTSKTTDFSNMFSGSPDLETIVVGDDWTVPSGANTTGMFAGCDSLTGGADSTGLTPTDGTVAKVDGGSEHPGYLTYYLYALVFDANGGTGAPDVVTSKTNTLTIPTGAPQRAGYIFKGWANSAYAAEAQHQAGESYTSSTPYTPACDTLYAVWEEAVPTTKEVYVEFVDASNLRFQLWADKDRTIPLIAANDPAYSANLVGSGATVDANGYPYVASGKLGTVLTAYAENNFANLIVFSNGYSQHSNRTAVNLKFEPTRDLTMLMKPYYFGTELESVYKDLYWMGQPDNVTTSISNVTLDAEGFVWPGVPITAGRYIFTNVIFKNFVAGKDLNVSDNQVFSAMTISPSDHEAVVCGHFFMQNYCTAENVQFINCQTSGCYLHFCYGNTCVIEAGQQPLNVYLSTKTGTEGAVVNVFSDPGYSTSWVVEEDQEAGIAALNLTEFRLSELSTKLEALGDYAQSIGKDGVNVYTTGIFGNENEDINIAYTNSAAVKMNLVRHKDNEVIATSGTGTLTLSGLSITGGEVATDKPLIRMNQLVSTSLTDVSMTTAGFTGTLGSAITYTETHSFQTKSKIITTNLTIDGAAYTYQDQEKDREKVYFPSFIMDFSAVEALMTLTGNSSGEYNDIYLGFPGSKSNYFVPKEGMILPETIYLTDIDGKEVAFNIKDEGLGWKINYDGKYNLFMAWGNIVGDATYLTQDVIVQPYFKYYYSFTDESDGITASVDKTTEIPAALDLPITLTPEEGKVLPSSFTVEINGMEYPVNTTGSNANGITVKKNSDGTCVVTVPAELLMENFDSSSENNTITVKATAVSLYTVTTKNLNNVTISHPATVLQDATCTATLVLSAKHVPGEISVTINGTIFTKAQFAEKDITLSGSGTRYTLTIPASLLTELVQDGDNTIVLSASAIETPKYLIQAGTLTGADLTPHDSVYADETCSDIVLTIGEDTPILENITVDINGIAYTLNATTSANEGVKYTKSGTTYTLTVPANLLTLHLKSEGDNVVTVSAAARKPVTTYATALVDTAHNSYKNPPYNSPITTFTEMTRNEDGSLSVFLTMADGFILDRYAPIQVQLISGGVVYINNLSGQAVTGDVSFDPETGEVKISKDFLDMFKNQDVEIRVLVQHVLREIDVTTASEVSNLTTSSSWLDIDEQEVLISTITRQVPVENEWMTSVKVRVSYTGEKGVYSEDFTLRRVESLTPYQNMTYCYVDAQTEQIVFSGSNLIELLNTWIQEDGAWVSDSVTITFTEMTYGPKTDDTTPAVAGYAANEPGQPRLHVTSKVYRLNETPPQPTPVEPTEPEVPQDIPVNFDLTDLSYQSTGDSAKPGEDYQAAFFYEAGFTLPEIITVTIDETQYHVYTDGLEHREGEDMPPMPTFVPGEDILIIPGVLLTEDTQSVSIAAAGIPEAPVGEEETEPPADEDTPGEDTQPPADEETQPPADEETQPPEDEETQPPADEETQPPADEETQPPADEETQPPADEETQPAADEETQPPADEETQPPADEETQPPADGNHSTPEQPEQPGATEEASTEGDPQAE